MGGFRQASGRGKEDNDRELHESDRRSEEGSRRLQSLIAFGAILFAVGISVALFAVGCEKQQKDPPKREAVAERVPQMPPPPPAVAPRQVHDPLGIPDCMRYQQLHYTLQQCDKLPQQARDALRQGFDAMRQGWSSADFKHLPPEAHHAIAQSCRSAADALMQIGQSTCGLGDNPITVERHNPYARAEAPANAGGQQLPQACTEYRSLIHRLQSCEKMPQQARDALQQGFDAMEQGWANVGAMPVEAQKALADGCAKGTEALKHAAAATCEW